MERLSAFEHAVVKAGNQLMRVTRSVKKNWEKQEVVQLGNCCSDTGFSSCGDRHQSDWHMKAKH